MPSYKFTITFVVGAQTEDEAKKIFIEDCAYLKPEQMVDRAEVEEISE
jgi:hypothetical protein